MENISKKLIEKSILGNRQALEKIVENIQDSIFGLGLRMLYDPDDAEDACQEILIRVVTNLATFKGDSAFETWVYRIACNHLLSIRKKQSEVAAVSFQEYGDQLDKTSSYEWDTKNVGPLENLIVEETRIGCLQGMLLCLNRDQRIVFLLQVVFHVSSKQGAEILGISAEAFRKRLSRAKEQMHDFLFNNCALVNPDNGCKCKRYAAQELKRGIKQEELTFAGKICQAKQNQQIQKHLSELDELDKMKELFNSYSDHILPIDFVGYMKQLIHSGKFDVISS